MVKNILTLTSARNGGPVDLSPSTIYRWVAAGYDGMTNMELRRKVGYRPRSHRAPERATPHSPRRSHAAFLGLGEDACAAAWEMDTVEGSREDSACLLTLLHVSVNIFFTIFTNVFSPIAPTRMRRIRLRGCAAFGV